MNEPVRVEVVVTPAELDLAVDVLWRYATLGVEERDGPVRLLATFADADAARTAMAALVAAGFTDVAVAPAPEIDWSGVHADRPPVVVAGRALELDVGATFGWGGHPSTRLVLDRLDADPPAGRTVLDVGCGSGVLAVAAAVLGAGAVTAIDVDPVAVTTTMANARRNGVAVSASTTPAADVDGVFDLVMANVLVTTHRDLAADVAASVARGGVLVVSGVLDGQAEELADRYAGAGLAERSRHHLDGWAAIVFHRPG